MGMNWNCPRFGIKSSQITGTEVCTNKCVRKILSQSAIESRQMKWAYSRVQKRKYEGIPESQSEEGTEIASC